MLHTSLINEILTQQLQLILAIWQHRYIPAYYSGTICMIISPLNLLLLQLTYISSQLPIATANMLAV